MLETIIQPPIFRELYIKSTIVSKILLIDIETAPNLGYVWGKWEQNVIEFKDDWYILCFVAKWLDKRGIITSKLTDFSTFKKDPKNDRGVVEAMWKLFNEADIIIAHNGDAFDIKKANARFIAHNMTPPEPYKTIDTKKVAKRYFKFDSNKLDELGRYLGLGRKLQTGGFKLWLDCMAGKRSAWATMIKYNKQDVFLLEDIYNKLKPWIVNHPNVNVFDETKNMCPKCGSNKIQKRGWSIAGGVSRTRRYQCQACGGWCRGKTERIKELELR